MNKKNILITALLTTFMTLTVQAEMKEFRILAGTNSGPWNTMEQIVEVKVGDVLRIYNDDTVNHQLHTFGAPCPHGSLIKPMAFFDCKILKEYDASKDQQIYDHLIGPQAPFFMKAIN